MPPVALVSVERSILALRGDRVILDADLAALHGVSTKAFNQAVKRNAGRFPPDFRFQLTGDEKAEVVTNCHHLRRLRFSATRPWANERRSDAQFKVVFDAIRELMEPPPSPTKGRIGFGSI